MGGEDGQTGRELLSIIIIRVGHNREGRGGGRDGLHLLTLSDLYIMTKG